MYCPSCGKDVNSGLIFCNHCGARLAPETDADPNALSESSFNLLVAALLTIPVVGIGLILGLLVVMKKELGFKDEVVMSVIFLSFLLLLAAEGGFIWLMLTRTKTRKTKHRKSKTTAIKGSGDVSRTLGEGAPLDYSQPAASVTEHTTRTLDPVPRERR